MKQKLNKILWIAFIALTPATLIGLLSQNSIPGQILYPVKITIEHAGLLVFAFTPEANASYNSQLTQRRFDEATTLLTQNSNTEGLTALVNQAEKTADSTSKIENTEQKQEAKEKLIQDITEYQKHLTDVQQSVKPEYIPPTPTPTSIPSPTPTLSPPIQNKTQTEPINKVFKTSTSTPSPTTIPVPTVPPNTPESPDEIVNEIEETKQKLEDLKSQIQTASIELSTSEEFEESYDQIEDLSPSPDYPYQPGKQKGDTKHENPKQGSLKSEKSH